jgi:integrase
LRLSWDSDAPFAVSLSGRFPAFAIEARAQKGRRDERLPMTPDFARWLLDNTPEGERTGIVFKLPTLRNGPDGKPVGKPIGLAKVTLTLSKIGQAAGVVVAIGDKQVVDKETGKKVTVTVKKFASAHDLRRAFGTRWARKVMPAVLQRLMRHTDIATTMKFYVSIEADDVAAQLWGLENVAGNISGNNHQIAPKNAVANMPEAAEAKLISEGTCAGESSEASA